MEGSFYYTTKYVQFCMMNVFALFSAYLLPIPYFFVVDLWLANKAHFCVIDVSIGSLVMLMTIYIESSYLSQRQRIVLQSCISNEVDFHVFDNPIQLLFHLGNILMKRSLLRNDQNMS